MPIAIDERAAPPQERQTGQVDAASSITSERAGGVGSSRRRPFVRLNEQWSRFTQPKRDLILLGTVQCGLEIGALARTPQGEYVQINGSVIRELNRSRIKAAIQRATRALSMNLARDGDRLARQTDITAGRRCASSETGKAQPHA